MNDTILKAAREDLIAVLKKHDICGTLVIADECGMSVLNHFTASWLLDAPDLEKPFIYNFTSEQLAGLDDNQRELLANAINNLMIFNRTFRMLDISSGKVLAGLSDDMMSASGWKRNPFKSEDLF